MNALKTLLATAAVAFAMPAYADVTMAVSDAYAGMSVIEEGNGTVYFTIMNTSRGPDALIGATSAAAASVELRESIMTSKGVRASYAAPAGWNIAQGGGFTLAPGGLELMLLGLKAPLKDGDVVSVTLKFVMGDEITIDAPVNLMRASNTPK